MHIVAWLLTQRAIESGEIAGCEGGARSAGSAMPRTAIPLVVATLAAVGAAADQRQRRPLRAGQAARRGRRSKPRRRKARRAR